MALTQTQVSQLYVAIFNRASEGAGNTYWQSSTDMATCANYMLATTDAQTYFGTSLNTNQAFIEHIYLNTLNKSATDDPAGIAYWKGLLDNGMSRGEVVAALVTAVGTYASSTDPTTANAYNQFTNRVTVSNYMANTVSAAPTDYATSTSFSSGLPVTYNSSTVTSAQLLVGDLVSSPTYTITPSSSSVTEGSSLTFTVTTSIAKSTAQTLAYQISGVEVAGGTATPASDLGKVTGEVTIAAGATTGTFTLTPLDDGTTEGFEGFKISLLDTNFQTVASSSNVVIKDGAEAGQTYSLTTGADNKTGGVGNDSFDGSLSAASMTFGPADTIDGGAGTDTLTIIANAAGTYAAGSLKNVENVSLTASGGAVTLSLSGVTGVETVTNSGSSEDVTISGLASLNTVLKVANTGADDSTTFAFAASVVSGAADTATLHLNGIAHTTVNNTDEINIQDVETINIVTYGGASTVDSFDTDATKFVITGDQNLTIGQTLHTNNAGITTVDASAFTGGLTFTYDRDGASTLTGGSGNDAITITGTNTVNELITAGAGNDTVTYAANLATTDTVNGGDGTDTLQLTTALATAYTKLATATITNFEILKLSNALAGPLTVANVQAGLTTLDLNAGSGAQTVTMEAGSQNVNIGASNTGTLVIQDTGTATTDSVTVTNTGTADDMFDGNDLTITGFETLNLVGTGKGAATSQDIGALGITADTGGSTTVNFSGSNSFTATTINAKTISASGLSGSAVLTMAGATTGVAQTITGGANNDKLYIASDTAGVADGGAGDDTVAGGTGNDSLTGGDGNDSITADSGNDTINGGAGNDVILMAGNLATGDVIDGGDGAADTISMTSAGLDTIRGYAISAVTNLNNAMSNVERLFVSNAFDLGAAFDMARLDSISYITLEDGINGNEEISGLANNSTIVMTHDNNSAGTLTLTLADSTGSSDILNYTMTQAADDDYDDITVSGVETLNITANEATADSTVRVATLGLNITTATAGTTVNFLGTETITIDTAIAAQTINSSSLEGAFIMTNTTGSSLNQTITTGVGADTIYGGAGADTIDAGAGGDSIIGGTGADSITGGTGADTIDGGSGNDSIILTESSASSDVVRLSWSGGTDVDSVTGFTTGTSGDVIAFDVSELVKVASSGGVHTTATVLANLDDADAPGVTEGVQIMTAAAAAAVDANIFVLSGTTFSSTSEVEDGLEVGGSRAISGVSGTIDAQDLFFVAYSDGVDAYIASARLTADDDGTTFDVGALSVTNLAKIVGVSSISSTTFVAGNFDFV